MYSCHGLLTVAQLKDEARPGSLRTPFLPRNYLTHKMYLTHKKIEEDRDNTLSIGSPRSGLT